MSDEQPTAPRPRRTVPAGAFVIAVMVAAALAVLSVVALWQRAELAQAAAANAALTRDLATARAIQAQAEEAAAVHRAHLARIATEAEAWADLTRDLQEMEGRNAPLSDHLGAVAGRLWP